LKRKILKVKGLSDIDKNEIFDMLQEGGCKMPLSDLPQRNIPVGELNPLRDMPNPIVIPEIYRTTVSDQEAVSYVLNKVVEKDARTYINFPARAIALDSFSSACRNPIEGSSYARTQEKSRVRLYVRARIPELHSSLPEPDRVTHADALTRRDRMIINMHHVFIADFDDIRSINVPAPGDIILIDYDDHSKFEGGRYKGIVERGPGSIFDRSSPAFSGRGYFEKSKFIRNKPMSLRTRRERSLSADFYQHPLTLADYRTD
jgi:hypothetical protein